MKPINNVMITGVFPDTGYIDVRCANLTVANQIRNEVYKYGATAGLQNTMFTIFIPPELYDTREFAEYIVNFAKTIT